MKFKFVQECHLFCYVLKRHMLGSECTSVSVCGLLEHLTSVCNWTTRTGSQLVFLRYKESIMMSLPGSSNKIPFLKVLNIVEASGFDLVTTTSVASPDSMEYVFRTRRDGCSCMSTQAASEEC